MPHCIRSLGAALAILALAACNSGETPAQPSSESAVDSNWIAYTPAAFEQAQADGRTIIVDVFATWCPTCKAQAPILDELQSEQRLEDAMFFKVDYDEHEAFLKAHRIPRQSTILVFNGREEVARSIAETDRERLRAVVLDSV